MKTPIPPINRLHYRRHRFTPAAIATAAPYTISSNATVRPNAIEETLTITFSPFVWEYCIKDHIISLLIFKRNSGSKSKNSVLFVNYDGADEDSVAHSLVFDFPQQYHQQCCKLVLECEHVSGTKHNKTLTICV